MFTPEERELLRTELLDRASAELRILVSATTGSGATDHLDKWSDIDMAFAFADGVDLHPILSDWTAWMYDRQEALHHFDVMSGTWAYRVFLLRNTLQVDLAFVPASDFRALAPSFRLVFGEDKDPPEPLWPPVEDMIVHCWLYALHARCCIARGQYLRAEYMISAMRNETLSFACVRYGLPSVHGRGIDRLPSEFIERIELSLVKRLDEQELLRAFRALMEPFINEVKNADPAICLRLVESIRQLAHQ